MQTKTKLWIIKNKPKKIQLTEGPALPSGPGLPGAPVIPYNSHHVWLKYRFFRRQTNGLFLQTMNLFLTLDPGNPGSPERPDSPVAPWGPIGPLAPRSPGAPWNVIYMDDFSDSATEIQLQDPGQLLHNGVMTLLRAGLDWMLWSQKQFI